MVSHFSKQLYRKMLAQQINWWKAWVCKTVSMANLMLSCGLTFLYRHSLDFGSWLCHFTMALRVDLYDSKSLPFTSGLT